MTSLFERYEELTPKEQKNGKKGTPSKYPVSVEGRPIEEPTTGFSFSVTEDDVNGSVVKDKEHCAAANALCRLPDIEHAWVFKTVTLVKRSSGTIERYKNPEVLESSVKSFDRSAGLFPAGNYELKPLPKSSRQEYKKRWNDAHKDRSGGHRPYDPTTAPSSVRPPR